MPASLLPSSAASFQRAPTAGVTGVIFVVWLVVIGGVVVQLGRTACGEASAPEDRPAFAAWAQAGWRLEYLIPPADPAAGPLLAELARRPPVARGLEEVWTTRSGVKQVGKDRPVRVDEQLAGDVRLRVRAPGGEVSWEGRFSLPQNDGGTYLDLAVLAAVVRGEGYPPVVPWGCAVNPLRIEVGAQADTMTAAR